MPDRTFRWNPFRSMMRGTLADELEHLMRRAFDAPGGADAWAPRADLVETPETFVLELDAPGVKADDVHVTLAGATLTIKGESKSKSEERREHDSWHLAERQHGTFQRAFELPTAVDPGAVEAVLKDGVLTVTVRKAPTAKSSRIVVESG